MPARSSPIPARDELPVGPGRRSAGTPAGARDRGRWPTARTSPCGPSDSARSEGSTYGWGSVAAAAPPRPASSSPSWPPRGARLTWRPDMVLRRRAFDGAEPAPPSQRADGFGTGRMVRRLRAPSLAAAYAADLARAAAGAASHGDLRSIGATAANLAGFAAGLATPDRWTSPAAPLAHLPAPVRRALGRRRLRPWPVPHRVPLHLLWQAGPDLVLHLYVGVGAGFDAGAAARAAARRSGLGGVPAIVARADDEDVAWVLEERLPRSPAWSRWWTAPADWVVALAGTGGRPLRDTAWWSGDMARPTEASALADLPAVVVHGDVQPKNLLRRRHRRRRRPRLGRGHRRRTARVRPVVPGRGRAAWGRGPPGGRRCAGRRARPGRDRRPRPAAGGRPGRRHHRAALEAGGPRVGGGGVGPGPDARRPSSAARIWPGGGDVRGTPPRSGSSRRTSRGGPRRGPGRQLRVGRPPPGRSAA